MKIILNPKKSIHENASDYYDKAKKMKKKIKGVEEAIEQTKVEMEKAKKEEEKREREENERVVKKRVEREWFEKFHWFYTSEKKLCIGGKDSSQNDLIFKKYMDEKDIFFHADIVGGSVVILKGGVESTKEEREECAQFAASFSRSWKLGYSSIDVYSLKYDQLSKHSQGQFVGKGAIAMKGKREWFKKTPLKLRVGVSNNKVEITPDLTKKEFEKEVKITPGPTKKEESAKFIGKLLKVHVDEILRILPPGSCSIKQK